MLKQYIDRDNLIVSPVSIVSSVHSEPSEGDFDGMNFQSEQSPSKLQNSDILKNLDKKLSHLNPEQRTELKTPTFDIPCKLNGIYHGVEIDDDDDAKPVNNILIE